MNYTKEDLINVFSTSSKTTIDSDYEKYLEILSKILPKYLYRYCAHDNHNIQLIINEKISMSNPNNFNDPYDSYVLNSCIGRINRKYDVDKIILAILQNPNPKFIFLRDEILKQNILSSSISYEDKFTLLQELGKKYNIDESLRLNKFYFDTGDKGTNKRLGDKIPQSLIACFSECKENILMWAHYAKSFTGICIEYSTSELLNAVINKECFLIPIIYKKHPYVPCKINQIDNNILNSLEQFAVKSDYWDYEKEWRIVKFTDNIRNNITELKGIRNIFLGHKFEFYNKYAFHLTENGKIIRDNECDQILLFYKLINFAKKKKIAIAMTRPVEKKYEYEVDESQNLILRSNAGTC